MLATVEDIVRERERVSQALSALGYTPYESASNFLLVAGFSDPGASFQQLLDAGVLVRNVGIPGTLRITIGTLAENEALLKALSAIS
jgi:histidinol-phosphate aminotransferase